MAFVDNKILFALICVLLVSFLSVNAVDNSTEDLNQTDNPSQDDNMTIDTESNDTSDQNNTQDGLINETISDNNTSVPDDENQTPDENTTALSEEAGLLKTLLRLVLDKLSAVKGDIIEMTAFLSYENSSPVPDKKIDFYFDEDKIGEEYTDDEGYASVEYDTSQADPGTYEVRAEYTGSGTAEGSLDTAEVVIEEAEEEQAIEEEIVEPIVEETIVEEPEEIILTESNEPAITCDIEVIKVDETYYVDHTEERCHDVTEIDEYGKNITVGEECRNVSWQEPSTRKVDREVCKAESKRIEFNDKVLEFEKKHQNCKILENRIECDETCYIDPVYGRQCGDGDGDGVCEPGETCFVYPLTDLEIQEPTVMNGRHDVTHKYKSRTFVEVAK